MILFDNGIIKLDYNPATDILEVAYPDLVGYLLPEIKNSIDKLIDTLIGYDIKRMILNSSKTSVSVSPEESREITIYLITGLSRTRIQKLARVQSASQAVENLAYNNISHARQQGLLMFPMENFSDKETAIKWLLEE